MDRVESVGRQQLRGVRWAHGDCRDGRRIEPGGDGAPRLALALGGALQKSRSPRG